MDLQPTVTEAKVREIATAWEAVASEAPIISDRQYHRAEKRVDAAEADETKEAVLRAAHARAA